VVQPQVPNFDPAIANGTGTVEMIQNHHPDGTVSVRHSFVPVSRANYDYNHSMTSGSNKSSSNKVGIGFGGAMLGWGSSNNSSSYSTTSERVEKGFIGTADTAKVLTDGGFYNKS